MVFNFLILVIISSFWALGFLFVKVGERSITPISEMTFRAVIATITLVIICIILKKDLIKPLRKFRAFLLFSVLGVTIPWLGIAYSEEIISSALAATMLAILPIFTYLITTFIIKTEKFTMHGAAGLAIALLGLVLVIGVNNILSHNSTLMGAMIILGAFFSYAVNGILVPVYAKDTDPFVIITYTIGFAAIIIAVLAFIIEEPTMIPFNTDNILALLGLAVISTAFGFSGYYFLIDRAGPFFTSLLGYLAPVFGVIFGVVFLDNHFNTSQLIGIVLVLFGIVLINKQKIVSIFIKH
jgi:drug/metabolite transporter (DMT)-like permease